MHHQFQNLSVPSTSYLAYLGKQAKTNNRVGCFGNKDRMRRALKKPRETLGNLLLTDLVAQMWEQTDDGRSIIKRCSADCLAHGMV